MNCCCCFLIVVTSSWESFVWWYVIFVLIESRTHSMRARSISTMCACVCLCEHAQTPKSNYINCWNCLHKQTHRINVSNNDTTTRKKTLFAVWWSVVIFWRCSSTTLRFRKFYKWPRQSDINQLSYQFPLDIIHLTAINRKNVKGKRSRREEEEKRYMHEEKRDAIWWWSAHMQNHFHTHLCRNYGNCFGWSGDLYHASNYSKRIQIIVKMEKKSAIRFPNMDTMFHPNQSNKIYVNFMMMISSVWS